MVDSQIKKIEVVLSENKVCGRTRKFFVDLDIEKQIFVDLATSGLNDLLAGTDISFDSYHRPITLSSNQIANRDPHGNDDHFIFDFINVVDFPEFIKEDEMYTVTVFTFYK